MFLKLVALTILVSHLTLSSGKKFKLCTGVIRDNATDISYSITHNGWGRGLKRFYKAEVKTPVGNYSDWKIQLQFPRPVTHLEAFGASVEGPYNENQLWFLAPKHYNFIVTNDVITIETIVQARGKNVLEGIALLYNNGAYPTTEDHAVLLEEDCTALLRRGRTVTTPAPPLQGCELPNNAQDLFVELYPRTWKDAEGRLAFSMTYTSSTGDYKQWKIKMIFSEPVLFLDAHNAQDGTSYSDGHVWIVNPRSYNSYVSNGVLFGTAVAYANSTTTPTVRVIVFKNNAIPDGAILSIDECVSTPGPTGQPTTTEEAGSGSSADVTTAPLTPGWVPTSNVTGILPATSQQTVPNFTPSPDVDADEPYDYNEILHKSILFYEAQRSGELPSDNRIPWRGDSGLRDGCSNGVCVTDLTGGYYDAGDHVKFGFPMAWSTTVLAWGMIEFRKGYKISGEWKNAMDQLKWATDYLMKAHTSPYELYFQVGNPRADHETWGHPETMTLDRPIFKIDRTRPGSEVAAETAAALAAASMIFTKDTDYQESLLQHAMELYQFADLYRGHYHESVPESGVQGFYKSWSGYNDELAWAAMWLYKATNKPQYLADAITCSKFLGESEFSWDQKGPGALVLLSEEEPEYKTRLFAAIDRVMSSQKTPEGLVFIQPWGSNRHAANYALISLMTARIVGPKSQEGQKYYNFGKEQIMKMLGSGDNNRSYVVGFGHNPPQRPHHRASSCPSWTEDVASQECDFGDLNADIPNPQILYGALVGGPDQIGDYADKRSDYVKNEVAIDYNAGFQSAIAGLRLFQSQSST